MRRTLAWAALPLLLVAAVAAILLVTDPMRGLDAGVPPIERLSVERTVLDGDGIPLTVRAGGSEPVELAQIQVDGAYWSFSQDPPGPIGHLATVTLRLPYPWVQAETHRIVMLTRSGLAFEHVIDVAVATPAGSAGALRHLALIGLTVGLLPVALGMLFFPALRAGGRGLVTFALALTVGLLAFLLVDTMSEALELAAEATPDLKATPLVWLVAASAAVLLFAAGRITGRRPAGAALATSIALGIGLHNMGEGLADPVAVDGHRHRLADPARAAAPRPAGGAGGIGRAAGGAGHLAGCVGVHPVLGGHGAGGGCGRHPAGSDRGEPAAGPPGRPRLGFGTGRDRGGAGYRRHVRDGTAHPRLTRAIAPAARHGRGRRNNRRRGR